MKIRVSAVLLSVAFLILNSFGCSCSDDSSSSSGQAPAIDDDSTIVDDTADDTTDVVDDVTDDTDDDVVDDSYPPDDDTDPYDILYPYGPKIGRGLGVSSHMSTSAESWKRDFEIEKLMDIGAMRIRRDFHWSNIEPENDAWHWDDMDTFYNLAQDLGLKFDALLVYGVDWAMPGGTTSEIPPEDYADYAAHVAARYCDSIKQYEIWNEENLSGRFWLPHNDPEHYGEMLKAAYDAIKLECPDAQVVFGGMSPFFDILDSALFGIYHYFDRVVSEHPDICDYFDAMAIHPYAVAQNLWPELAFQLLTAYYPSLPGQVDDIRRRMQRAGCGEKPVLWTEFGWPSVIIGKYNQASWLARGILLGAMKGVEGFYWYTFWDGSGSSIITEDYFGLFEEPDVEDPAAQVAKPSYVALKTLSSILGDTQYAGNLSGVLGLPEDVYALAFMEGDARIVVALWDGSALSHATAVSLPVPPGFATAAITRLDGSPANINASDPIDLILTGDVIYVEFEK